MIVRQSLFYVTSPSYQTMASAQPENSDNDGKLPDSPRFGIALGGGGVRGLAHIAVLETLDEMGIRPSVIAGTSMGAIVGALYASGRSGSELADLVRRHAILKTDGWKDLFEKRANLLRWIGGFAPDFSGRGLLNARGILEILFEELQDSTFERLPIPMVVVAADYRTGEEVTFRSGALLSAVRASMAVPGIFTPEVRDGQVLIDGGVVNNLPFDHVKSRADVTIAVNVSNVRVRTGHEVPTAWECAAGALQIMESSMLREKLRNQKPDILIQPEITGVAILDFGKVEEVMRQAQTACHQLREDIGTVLERRANREGPTISKRTPES